MIKEIAKLFVAFGIIGGVAVGPGLVKENNVNAEPNLELPTVGTYENLKEIISKSQEEYKYRGDVFFGDLAMNATLESAVATKGDTALDDAVSETEYSETNTQVKGVDEADIVKTDGKYIYHLIDNELVISRVYPEDSMEIMSKITYDDGFFPRELYINKDMLIVIGEQYKKAEKYSRESYTKVIIYNVADRKNPKVEKEVEVTGTYNSSRRIDDSLYLVSQKYISLYREDEPNYDIMPLYRDSLASDELKQVECSEIRYFPDFKCTEYMITVGIDLSNLEKEASISTYLGSSESIYASSDNMYITFTSYEKENSEENDVTLKRVIDYSVRSQNTSIYRFKLENGEMNPKATGKVPGSILNQFSMDENNGYFRIATTKGSITGTGENVSKNNMYVLDMDLKTVGSIEDIAPGEKIYSVRYMGNRAYMVTFRKVDPLFVIDLSSPTNPEILGKLKIPGYSDYLHPYDENHIIGFGKDAEVVNNETGSWGWADEDGTAAYYQGLKIAMFDVTDPTNPIEMWKENIGDRGTDSELLYNHKALLFSKDKNLLAFPVKVCEVTDKNRKAWTYGDMTFSGAYVYELTLENGFNLKAKLTNLTESDWKKIGYYYYGEKEIDRLLYIDDVLYTISDYGYGAYSLENFNKLGELKIK